MSLSAADAKSLAIALANKTTAESVATEINKGAQVADKQPALTHYLAGAIVATSTSQTTDFAVLLTTDKVIMVPATAGNADFITPSAAGDLGQAAVVGNLYLVIRAVATLAAAADVAADF